MSVINREHVNFMMMLMKKYHNYYNFKCYDRGSALFMFNDVFLSCISGLIALTISTMREFLVCVQSIMKPFNTLAKTKAGFHLILFPFPFILNAIVEYFATLIFIS